MNYRHAYHVGNIGDVLKHAVLTRLILYFQRKEKGFRVLDTHAGIGRYDLTSVETRKTGEWQQGIDKVMAADFSSAAQELLAPWLDVIQAENPNGELKVYPGSPLLARRLMRNQDRLTLTELHPADYATLAKVFADDFQVKTIHLDAWLALNSFLPPKEKRGLVIIDPAYEETDEFEQIANAVVKGWRKWTTGTFAIWYPLKDLRSIRRMHQTFKDEGLKDVLRFDLRVAPSNPDSTMMGSGMTIINPPFTLANEMNILLPELCEVLRTTPGAGWSLEQIIDE
ncbi:23S rRNA (adenine(2030)-N(6))-methyltransferase RlmJ [Roseibium limicola]|uniref:Ribosomal RNA large subunit methyltransferase J n=1 Tax=Roseibium limicola TaxID=2816037 RepID=A0A939J7H4_9HYPH|nr:23S rRNA (adenine(2030)-N(6))-methyltransferase RlmJ [Roseibium limicola]MBO0343809.1 23S rRNA (adenine(2030)-N(6))-methyltransferase RlmJ [Roseibium limicola]